MPSTNGHGSRRAILYTRVSGDSQRDHGYSLSDQRRELDAWAAKEGYEVVEVVEDGAWSGASLVRPGLDRVRELVHGGAVDVVVALFRDRLARGVYAGLLSEEFAEHGCRLIALNAQLDDSPEGELHGGMLDIIAAWERKKFAERTRRGKLQKARQGEIVATHRPPFGFSYNEGRTNYVVNLVEMRVVRRIFEMVAEGAAINAVEMTFDREGVPTPGGARFWSQVMIRKILTNDLYKAHSFVEVAQLVSPRRDGYPERKPTLRRLLVRPPEGSSEAGSGERHLPREDQEHDPRPGGADPRAHARPRHTARVGRSGEGGHQTQRQVTLGEPEILGALGRACTLRLVRREDAAGLKAGGKPPHPLLQVRSEPQERHCKLRQLQELPGPRSRTARVGARLCSPHRS